MLVAIGKLGAILLNKYPEDWKTRLKKLEGVDWSRSNPQWHETVIFGGSIKKNGRTINQALCLIKENL